ncbi:hypothetical protein B296_00018213 [Ensete ventricosum]|uniref:Uncharacterized protein n=1 Tax=Ensete ventricosum TaxID=4639 RepID=A0A427A1Y7_ENSVE|nr:hypothetical protein B296_00018213 [Ensete ventricosum]
MTSLFWTSEPLPPFGIEATRFVILYRTDISNSARYGMVTRRRGNVAKTSPYLRHSARERRQIGIVEGGWRRVGTRSSPRLR